MSSSSSSLPRTTPVTDQSYGQYEVDLDIYAADSSWLLASSDAPGNIVPLNETTTSTTTTAVTNGIVGSTSTSGTAVTIKTAYKNMPCTRRGSELGAKGNLETGGKQKLQSDMAKLTLSKSYELV
mmetsp:Transcript_18940/g.54576  ORF Transcript_18940/g.54576 Transcript_18940/m.54576 type:complete len:125 (-) Transcript_18940:73-447(-)